MKGFLDGCWVAHASLVIGMVFTKPMMVISNILVDGRWMASAICGIRNGAVNCFGERCVGWALGAAANLATGVVLTKYVLVERICFHLRSGDSRTAGGFGKTW